MAILIKGLFMKFTAKVPTKLTSRVIRMLAGLLLLIALMLSVIYGLFRFAQVAHDRVSGGYVHEEWILSNVNIVGVNDEFDVLKGQDIFIRQGVIEAIRPHSPLAQGIHVVNASGLFVSPGIIDAHVHVEDSAYLGLALSYGVTTVRGMRGNSTQLRWRNEINQGDWLGSRFLVASPIISGQSGDPFHRTVTTPEQLDRLVGNFAQDGYDLIKLYASVNEATFDLLVKSAKQYELPIAKHGPYPVAAKGAESLKSMQSLEHIEDIYAKLLNYSIADAAQMDATFDELAHLDIPIVTTLAVFAELSEISLNKYEYLETLPLEYMSDAHRQLSWLFGVERWLAASEALAQRNTQDLAHLKFIVAELHKRGVPLVVGSDSGALVGQSGAATHHEIQLLIDSGLSPKAALTAATVSAANMLGLGDQIGVIRPGYVADLVLTTQNPLQDINALTNPHAVVYQGQYLDKTALHALRENAKQTLPVWLGYPLILWHSLENILW